MRVFYSELCLIGGGVEANVDRLIENGAENIELMLDGAGWNGFHLRREELALALKAKRVGFSVHVPVWDANLTCENAQLREAVMETYRQSIMLAASLGARHVVLHTGFCADSHFCKAAALKRSREAMLSLLEFNERYGRLLLVENVGAPARSIFTQQQFIDFLGDFPEGIGYIVDVGHAHINGWRIESLLRAVKERLYALHIHDNDGGADAHAPLGEGSIDWNGVFAAARDTGRDLSLILEYQMGTALGKLAEGKAILETAFSRSSGARPV